MPSPPQGAARRTPPSIPHVSVGAREALRSTSFWLLSGAFFLATGAAIAFMVQGIPFLLERGYSPAFAAFSIGVIGISQIPGRLLFAPLAERLPHPWGTVALFALIAAGIGLIVGVDATAAVIAGLVLLGMGNGMATLARATVIADRYGPAAYGTIASVAAPRPSALAPPRPSRPPPTRPWSATARCSSRSPRSQRSPRCWPTRRARRGPSGRVTPARLDPQRAGEISGLAFARFEHEHDRELDESDAD